MKIVGEKILVQVDQAKETTESGVFIPTANRKENEGTVLLVGDKAAYAKVGDRVRFFEGVGQPIEYHGKKCIFLRDSKSGGEIELFLD